jgi:alpha-N-arabinofuranosidase
VDWESIGHALSREQQLDLTGFDMSDGVWAPTIRYHDGIYYIVATIAENRRGATTFVVTANNPAGPWSDPVVLDAEGIDPSLFFDTDGRCWFTACRDAAHPAASGPGELWMRELDVTALRLVGPLHVLWHGAVRGAWIEAPRVFLHAGVYHLIGAEGGTERNHSVTAATAATVTGPYVADPRNPLLTHRHLGPEAAIQNVGHADLVDTPDGATWAVVLGIRPIDGHHTLGRETFLVPVEWTSTGMVFAPGHGQVRTIETAPRADPCGAGQRPQTYFRDEFAGPVLDRGWCTLRAAGHRWWNLDDGLELSLLPWTLSEPRTPAFLGRRQQHLNFLASVAVEFQPMGPHEDAGIALLQNENHYVTATIRADPTGMRIIEVSSVIGGVETVTATAPAPAGGISLGVRASGLCYEIIFRSIEENQPWRCLAEIDRRLLSAETSGSFLGVYLGLYATGRGHSSDNTARFRSFHYQGDDMNSQTLDLRHSVTAGQA